MDTFCVSASTLSRDSALSHETLPVTRIYRTRSAVEPAEWDLGMCVLHNKRR